MTFRSLRAGLRRPLLTLLLRKLALPQGSQLKTESHSHLLQTFIQLCWRDVTSATRKSAATSVTISPPRIPKLFSRCPFIFFSSFNNSVEQKHESPSRESDKVFITLMNSSSSLVTSHAQVILRYHSTSNFSSPDLQEWRVKSRDFEVLWAKLLTWFGNTCANQNGRKGGTRNP